jgi:adenylylsulfate kinase-like enzyme
MSKLMTIEIRGPQGCGKSTTAHDLMVALSKKGFAVELHDGEVLYKAQPHASPLHPVQETAVLITVKQ